MQVFINEQELLDNIETDSMLELLRIIQDTVEKKEETIVKVLVDEMESPVDLTDEDSDISLDYIDRLDIFTEHINNVSVAIVNDFRAYFENVVEQLPLIAQKLVSDNSIAGVDNIYQVVEGIQQVNVAFNSLVKMGKIDLALKNEAGTTLNDVLGKVNDVILDIVEKLKVASWIEAKDLVELDFALKINEFIDFFPVVEKSLRGEK